MKTISHRIVELDIDSTPTRFYFNYAVCQNPDCDCNGLTIQLSNKDRRLDFFFDFSTETYKQDKYTKDETKIINAFIDFMKSDEQDALTIDFLKRIYTSVKEHEQNKKEVLEDFPLGSFLPYSEILWREKTITLTNNKREYIIYDAYCVTPGCPCTTVALWFVENIHKIGIRQPDFSFIYNYTTHEINEPIGIQPEAAKQFTNTFSASLHNKFKQRHAQLKEEVKQDIEKKIEEGGYTPFHTKKRKIGRNDPCHCGSGKKYKKCCLQKDIEQKLKNIKG